MKITGFIFLNACLLTIFISSNNSQPELNSSDITANIDPSTFMWYEAPAEKWQDALPVGNGRLGAMVFGKYGEERIQLNEETYWTGGPYSTVVAGGYKVLPQIQKYIFEGKPLKAHKLFGRHLMGYPVEQQKYQALANLHLFFPDQDTVLNYHRSLDLNTGVLLVKYSKNGVNYKREVVASYPDQTIVIRLTADKPECISFDSESCAVLEMKRTLTMQQITSGWMSMVIIN